ncbi:MAG: response regulator [Arcobacteraceae bacterium]|nr:response regulator [Arcobacteraceae bacterium]
MSDVKKLKEKIKKLKVLFVDDEEQIRDMTGKLLKKFFDEVTICKNGKEGLDAFLKTKDFNIIIADIMMPKMDGITMVKKIKEIKPDIFTIFITASRGDYNVEDGLYDLYITKPISYEDITLIMKKVSEY